MKPWYKCSETWINVALAILGALSGTGAVSVPGVPPSVAQLSGLAAMALAAILHTTSRTTLKQQNSDEAFKLAAMAVAAGRVPGLGSPPNPLAPSIEVPIPKP